MNGKDSFFLQLETPRAYMHTFKIAILDTSAEPGGWSFARYKEQTLARLHLVPAFRWRLAPSPLGVNHPLWVEDEDFHLDYHLRRVACPAPGDQRALCEFMSAVYACQLDRSRPLWMTWVVEGLESGRVALVLLIHHAYFDGVGAAYAMARFFSDEPGRLPPTPERAWRPERYPSALTRLALGLRDLPGVLAEWVPLAFAGLRKKRRLDRARNASGKPRHPDATMMPHTPLNRALSHGRTFVCDSIPLDDFKRARRDPAVTINDVFMSCCAGAIRRLLADCGYDTGGRALVCGVPLSQQRPDDLPGIGNFASVDYCWLHSEIADPRERLEATHRAAGEMKAHAQESRGSDIGTLIHLAPPWLAVLARNEIRRRRGAYGLFGNVVLSNVPGPTRPLYLNHCKVERWFSTGQVFDGSSLNITMWSYCGSANLCILADQEILPDGWKLFGYFREELDALLQ